MQLAANDVTYWYLFSHPESGGYEYEFVDAVPDSDKYHCAICTKVMRNARLVACCGKHFCDSCLRKWMESARQKICPHCREVGFQDVLNKEKIREINEFRIRCTNSDKGCEWVGELGEVKKHLESDSGCGYVEVKCSAQGCRYKKALTILIICGAVMERRHLSSHHETECVYRQYKCQHCGYTDTYDAIAGSGRIMNGYSNIAGSGNHYNECAEFPLECPNKCSDNNIRRKDLNTHKDTVCPLEPVKCPYRDYCSQCLRKDLDSHKKECDFRPYKCEYCGHNGTYISMSGKGKRWLEAGPHHYDACGQYPLECTNQCGENKIKRKDMKVHKDTCPLELVSCPFKQCYFMIPRSAIKEHMKECLYHPYKCGYCGHEGTYISITGKTEWGQFPSHYNECKLYPLKCLNNCGEKGIKRKDMKTHQDSCPLEPLDCPLQAVGCSAGKIVRKDKNSHYQENMQEHLLLVVQSHQQLAQSHQQLAQSHQQLVQSHQQLVQSHQQLAQSHQQLAQSHQQLTQSHQQLVGKNEELERKNEELARKVDELPSPFPSSSIN